MPRKTTPDPRIPAAAQALAVKMGTPKDYRVWLGEARVVIEAADAVDPLRQQLSPKQRTYLDSIQKPDAEWLLENVPPTEDPLVIKDGTQMTFRGCTPAVIAYLTAKVSR